MDREILFRGKRTDNGEWLEGYYAVIGKRNVIIALPEMYYTEDAEERYGNEIYDIVHETVCLYIGLTDKSGKKIFEGDIVETVYDGQQNPNYVVVWDEDELDLGCCDEIIVIGNIFDNPDLLEGGAG